MDEGPHVFAHRPSGCTDGEMSLCFNARGGNGCLPQCGYNDAVDHQPAVLVAEQMKQLGCGSAGYRKFFGEVRPTTMEGGT